MDELNLDEPKAKGKTQRLIDNNLLFKLDSGKYIINMNEFND